MKVALLGLGRIGQLHARTLAGAVGVELVVADALPDLAERTAAEVGATAMPGVEAALEAAEAVVVATPTDSHAEMVRAAMARGLTIFCEKPLAIGLRESETLAAEIVASGLPFQLGFQRRFDAGFMAARRLIASGELGTLYFISLATHDRRPASEEYISRSGGIFQDMSIHDLDALRYLTGGEVAEVHARGSAREFPVYEKYGDVDTAVATMRMQDGLLVMLAATRHDPLGHDVRTEIFGSKDSVAVGLGPKMPLRSLEPGVAPPAGPAWEMFLDRFEDAYRAEMLAFLSFARDGQASPCTARDGVEALRVAEALTISLREGRPVAVGEVGDAPTAEAEEDG